MVTNRPAAGPYASVESEFWYNVMPQAEMPMAGDVGGEFDVARIARFLTDAAKDSVDQFAFRLKEVLLRDPLIFHDLRQLLAISDKRAYLELSYLASKVKHPSKDSGLCGCQPWNMNRHPLEYFLRLLGDSVPEPVRQAGADLLVKYLLREGLAEAAQGFSGLTAAQLLAIYNTLVVPRESQQKAAKRRGHGCEGALARVLHACGVKVLPTDKHTNPMGAKDPNLDRKKLIVTAKSQGRTFSFDMLVLEGELVRVAVQSLIHTSDPGQYGVNKSDETVAIATQIRLANNSHRKREPLELWGLVDGVGFSENKADTINKMLKHFDCFVQLNTLYKAPLRLHTLGLCVVKAIKFSEYYTDSDVEAITRLYVPSGVVVLSRAQQPTSTWKQVSAGRAVVYLALL